MRVNVRRFRYICMPHKSLCGSYVYAFFLQVGAVGMSEQVRPEIFRKG